MPHKFWTFWRPGPSHSRRFTSYLSFGSWLHRLSWSGQQGRRLQEFSSDFHTRLNLISIMLSHLIIIKKNLPCFQVQTLCLMSNYSVLATLSHRQWRGAVEPPLLLSLNANTLRESSKRCRHDRGWGLLVCGPPHQQIVLSFISGEKAVNPQCSFCRVSFLLLHDTSWDHHAPKMSRHK